MARYPAHLTAGEHDDLPGALGQGRFVLEQPGVMLADHPGAGAGGGDDIVVAVEGGDDVAGDGGGVAGLSAATFLARADFDTLVLDAGGDVARQIAQMEDLIQQEVDAIIIWPTNGEAVVPAVRKAFQAEIPVIVTNLSPVVTLQIGDTLLEIQETTQFTAQVSDDVFGQMTMLFSPPEAETYVSTASAGRSRPTTATS